MWRARHSWKFGSTGQQEKKCKVNIYEFMTEGKPLQRKEEKCAQADGFHSLAYAQCYPKQELFYVQNDAK